MTPGCPDRKALLLSGAGARAAYEAGVLKALRELLPESECSPFSIYCGASGGALNAARLALSADDFRAGVDALAGFWTRIRPEQVYQPTFRGAAHAFGLPGSRAEALFDPSPLARLLATSFDFRPLAAAIANRSLHALCITCSGHASGQSVSFFQGRADLEPWRSRQRVGAHVKLEAGHVMASMAMPFLFPAVKLHREHFGDGCLRDPAPLSPALHLGADRLMVIASGAATQGSQDADREAMAKVSGRTTLADVLGHGLYGAAADCLASDIERVTQINDLLARTSGKARPSDAPAARPIELLVIEPSRPLDALALDLVDRLPRMTRTLLSAIGAVGERGAVVASCLLFEATYTQRLIELGRADAMVREKEILDFFGC